MHGRNAFRLTDNEREALRKYVERGGLLFADAICGSEPFGESFRREMAIIFPKNPGTHSGQRSDLDEQVRRRRPAARHAPRPQPTGRASRKSAILPRFRPSLRAFASATATA